MFNIKSSSKLINFAPGTQQATPPPATPTATTANKLVAALRSGNFSLQGSQAFSSELAAYLADNPDGKAYVKVIFTTDEPKAGRKDENGKPRAQMPVFLPTEAADYMFENVPQDVVAKQMEFAGKRANMPANDQLIADALANDYKTGSVVWYEFRALRPENGGNVRPFFTYFGKA